MNIIIYNKAIIPTWQREIDNLKEKITRVDQSSSLDGAEKAQQKQSLQEKIASLNADIAQCNQFLIDLEKKPGALVAQFRGAISDSLTKYERSHLKLPAHIRVCLYALDKKLDFITKKLESSSLGPFRRIQYLELCALVQDMYDEVYGKKDIDPDFIKLLVDLLERSHIGIGGSLPDDLNIGGTTTLDYREKLKSNKDLFLNSQQLLEREKKLRAEQGLPEEEQASPAVMGDDSPTPVLEPSEEPLPTVTQASPAAIGNSSTPAIEPTKEPTATATQASPTAIGDSSTPAIEPSEEPLSTAESIEVQYEKILKKLQTRIVVKNTLQTKIDHALEAVNEEVQAKKQKQESIDYHFYHQLLMNLWDLSHSKTTTDTATFITRFTQLTEDIIDTSSPGKKVAGAILGVVGLLLIAASIATLVATFGGSSLVSSVGIAFGMSLLSSTVVLSTTAVMTAATGAGLTFWGVHKFKEGEGRELSRAIHEVNEELTQLAPT